MPIHGLHGRPDGSATPRRALGPSRGRRWPGYARLLRAAGLFPDLVDLVDQVQELLGIVQVYRCLDLRALRHGLLQGVLELRELGVMLLGLIPVTPEDVEMMLGQLRALLFDEDRLLPVDLVFRVVV